MKTLISHRKFLTPCFILILLTSIITTGCTLKRENQSKKKTKKEQTISHKAYLFKGVELAKNGEFDKAEILFLKAIQMAPSDESSYLLVANIYLQKRDFEKVVQILSPTLQRFPNNGEFPYLLAVSFIELKQFKQAVQAAKRSAEIFEAWQKTEELNRSLSLLQSLAQAAENQ